MGRPRVNQRAERTNAKGTSGDCVESDSNGVEARDARVLRSSTAAYRRAVVFTSSLAVVKAMHWTRTPKMTIIIIIKCILD